MIRTSCRASLEKEGSIPGEIPPRGGKPLHHSNPGVLSPAGGTIPGSIWQIIPMGCSPTVALQANNIHENNISNPFIKSQHVRSIHHTAG